jgi:non-homologous end joining protein Ku
MRHCDERYLDSPYYITPDGQVGQDAFAVIREAMRGKGMVALVQFEHNWRDLHA